MKHALLIIGCGNMGKAIADTLHHSSDFLVSVVDTNDAVRLACTQKNMPAYATIAEAPAADSYLLAIKPQEFATYAAELTSALRNASPLIISIMAGIALSQLRAVSPRAVRVMPNLPATIGESMSVLCAPTLDAPSRAIAEKIFAAVGATAWVEDEAQLHAVTAVSGSGPAYVFAFMEALQHAAIAYGLSPILARTLVTQTLRGAALLADQSPHDTTTLRALVTSKGGTTQAALDALAAGGWEALIRTAVDAAATRSRELAGG